MSEKRLRISIIGLLAAVAIASFGCGGGSRANSTPGGDFITAVMPDIDLASGSESGNAGLGEPPSNGGGENGPGSSTGSTPGDGGNAPAGSTQSAQTTQQLVDNGNQEEDGENGPGSSTGSTPGNGGNAPPSSTQNTETARQFDYSIIPEGHIPLPPGHGLEAGQLEVTPRLAQERGNIVITCTNPPGFKSCGINIGADGLVTYDENEPLPIFEPAEMPLPRPIDAAQAPVIDFVNVLHVGSNVAPQADELTRGVDHNGVSVSYGQVRDGIGAERVLELLRGQARLEDKREYTGMGEAPGFETYSEPPTIRLAEGTSELYARFTARAVQLINIALPYDKRITLSAETLPANTGMVDVPEGEIFLKFDSIDTDNRALGSASLLSSYLVDSETNLEEVQRALKASVTINEREMRMADVYTPKPDATEWYHNWRSRLLDSRVANSDTILKYYNDGIFLSVVVHELMHALGFYHIDESRYSKSIMHSIINEGQINVFSANLPALAGVILVRNAGSSKEETTTEPAPEETTDQSNTPVPQASQGHLMTARARSVPGHILFPYDKAALLAVYGRFEPGTLPDELTAENLGPWTDTSFHLRGEIIDLPIGGASFGVASTNGLAQPWASGPTPWTDLADNEFLSGSATWSGALLGITSSSETVAGDVRLRVGLSSLNGRIDFTGMEKWGVNEAPGDTGTGATWGDGDLGYSIEVRGNTFTQTGGDEGEVTGAFFGAAHEAMGGVLERADLSAGFGGKR